MYPHESIRIQFPNVIVRVITRIHNEQSKHDSLKKYYDFEEAKISNIAHAVKKMIIIIDVNKNKTKMLSAKVKDREGSTKIDLDLVEFIHLLIPTAQIFHTLRKYTVSIVSYAYRELLI